MFCGPAVKGPPPPPGLCSDDPYPTCTTTCPTPGDACAPLAGGFCGCVPSASTPCDASLTGVCIAGACPSGQTCQEDFSDAGVPTCVCLPPGALLCSDQDDSSCALAPCPTGQSCQIASSGTSCDCYPTGAPICGAAVAPACDGACPPDESCILFGDDCACASNSGSVVCGDVTGPPTCTGECPLATPICADVVGTCTCIPSP